MSEIAVFHLDGSETTPKSSSAKRDEATLLYRLVGSIQTNSKEAEIANTSIELPTSISYSLTGYMST